MKYFDALKKLDSDNSLVAFLPHWNQKYIYIDNSWSSLHESALHKVCVEFVAICDADKVGPFVPHNCDVFNDSWITCSFDEYKKNSKK